MGYARGYRDDLGLANARAAVDLMFLRLIREPLAGYALRARWHRDYISVLCLFRGKPIPRVEDGVYVSGRALARAPSTRPQQ